MNSRIAASVGFPLLVLAACAGDGAVESSASGADVAAEIRNAAGSVVAHATARDDANGVRIRVEAAGLAPGVYGVHVHTAGRCDPPGFDSAGPHWNPTGRQHGAQNPQGPHFGDLPNLQVGTDRNGSLEFVIAGAELTGGSNALLDTDGAALLVHAGPDDYRTDPSGNSGARVACGVFG